VRAGRGPRNNIFTRLSCGDRSETTVKITVIMAVGLLMTASTIGVAAPARADVIYQFITPDANIACSMGRGVDGGHVACDIRHYSFQPMPCPTGPVNLVGDRFVLDQTSAEGRPARLDCHSDTMVYPGQPVLDWGQKKDMGTGFGSMQCQSVPAGTFSPSMFCTDFPNTRHYFHIYSDHFDMG
jgi:hypothetical protein